MAAIPGISISLESAEAIWAGALADSADAPLAPPNDCVDDPDEREDSDGIETLPPASVRPLLNPIPFPGPTPFVLMRPPANTPATVAAAPVIPIPRPLVGAPSFAAWSPLSDPTDVSGSVPESIGLDGTGGGDSDESRAGVVDAPPEGERPDLPPAEVDVVPWVGIGTCVRASIWFGAK